MSRNFLLGWALVASAAALVALGYALGRDRGDAVPAVDAAVAAMPAPATTGDAATAEPVDPFTVPAGFRDLPAEWRTDVEGELDGYAILFDVARRELIVERCRHRGYLDARSGRPIPDGWEFCTNVLWSSLARLDESSATATDRDGRAVDVTLALQREPAPPRLRLSFGDHDMRLVPGSKNDLFQAMDRLPVMAAQRQRLLALQLADGLSDRRVVEEAARRGGEARRVPVFVLPPEQERAREEARLREIGGDVPSGRPASPEDLAEEARRRQQPDGVDAPEPGPDEAAPPRDLPAPPDDAGIAEPSTTE